MHIVQYDGNWPELELMAYIVRLFPLSCENSKGKVDELHVGMGLHQQSRHFTRQLT